VILTGNFNAGGHTGPKIDYIFTTPQVQVREAEILHQHRGDLYPSDHFPIVARVEFSHPAAIAAHP
jgi:endonuclease/exonuclease/phosphatase family metal-dependent hydrolase